MSTVKILVGLPGSGKTTYGRYCEEYLGYVRLSKDEITRISRKESPRKYTLDRIEEAVKEGQNVVCDGTYISYGERYMLIQFVKSIGADVTICFFDVPFETCIKRNDERKEKYVSEKVIERLSKRMEIPTKDECDSLETIDDEWTAKHKAEIDSIIENESAYRKTLNAEINDMRKKARDRLKALRRETGATK